MNELTYIDLGLCSYRRTLEIQMRLWERVAIAGEDRAFLVLVEHFPPAITMGRRAQPQHLLASRERLAQAGVELHEATRGGSVTWHGPGQLVAYPIMRLDVRRGGLHGYVHDLEEAIIRLTGQFGIEATRCKGVAGVWVGREKIAAVGVAVKRWVTYHGLALNVCPDMTGFDLIVPCGLADRGVTSLTKLLGRPISAKEIKSRMVQSFADVMEFKSVTCGTGVPPVRVEGILPSSSSCLAVSSSEQQHKQQQQKQQQPDAAKMAATHEGKMPSTQTVRRLPTWFRRRLPSLEETSKVRSLLSELGLATVCDGAKCPNIGECFACGTATFMILGGVCTRACRFCAVPTGVPHPPRQDEPGAVAQACKRLALRHVVITCVTRDDLPDGGAGHFAKTVRAVRRELPHAKIEALTSDFAGSEAAIHTVLQAGVDIFNHNIETVPRLYPLIRPPVKMGTGSAPLAVSSLEQQDKKRQQKQQQPDAAKMAATHEGETPSTQFAGPVPISRASYRRSLLVLARASQWAMEAATPPLRIKSGIMVGLGETHQEVLDVLSDLRAVGCQLLTVGQYLAPSRQHVPVARFVPPEEFEQFRQEAMAMGFLSVASGPLVRSSYRAERMVPKNTVHAKSGQGPGRA